MREENPRWAILRWYVEHGKYLDRIAFDGDGMPFMEGDFTWNRRNPNRQEFVEPVPIDDETP